jgi:hypothetical protein
MLFHRLVASLVVLVALSAELCAQDLAPEVVQQIGAASKIRVMLVGGGRRTLYDPTVDASGLAYSDSLGPAGDRQAASPSPLPMAQVTRIQVPHGSHAGNGAKIGGALGLGLGVLGVVLASGDSWATPTAGEAVGAMLVTTAIGAGVGALVGTAVPRWKTVYASDDP